MRLPKQDNGKAIRVGDPGFLYKGVFHPIEWIGEEPYRVRGEVIVVRGNKIFLRYYKDSTREYSYRLPGGSLDLDTTPIEQARDEVREEALIDVLDITDTNMQYTEMYPEGFLLKKGDICIAYKGCHTRVYIGSYIGRVNKDTIDEHDLDVDMAKFGKFFPIDKVYKILRDEHIEALLNSSLVSEDDKSILRQKQSSAVDRDVEININKVYFFSRDIIGPSMIVKPIVDTFNNVFLRKGLGDTTTKRISMYKSIKSGILSIPEPELRPIHVYTPNYLCFENLIPPTEKHIGDTGDIGEVWYNIPLTFTRIGTVTVKFTDDEPVIDWCDIIDTNVVESLQIVTEAEDDPEEDDDIEDYGEDVDDDEDYGAEDIPDEDEDIGDYDDDDDGDVPEPIDGDETADYDDEGTEDDSTGDDGDVPEPIDGDETADYDDEGASDGDEPTGDDGDSDESTDDDIENQDGESNENTNVKNYNLMKDYSRVFYLVSDIMKRTDSLIYGTSKQNSVVSQVSKNLSGIKSALVDYIKFNFSKSSYSANIYQYNIFIQAIKINVEMLNKIQHLDTDTKQIDKK